MTRVVKFQIQAGAQISINESNSCIYDIRSSLHQSFHYNNKALWGDAGFKIQMRIDHDSWQEN